MSPHRRKPVLSSTSPVNVSPFGADSLGSVTFENGVFRRRVKPSSTDTLEIIIKSDSVRQLADEQRINDFWVTNDAAGGFSLWQKPLGKPIHPQMQSYATRLQAAKLWVKINQDLARDKLGLRDAHWENFGFSRFMRPVWIDHGSISPLSSGALGLESFLAIHIRSLDAIVQKPLIGAAFSNRYEDGLSRELARELWGAKDSSVATLIVRAVSRLSSLFCTLRKYVPFAIFKSDLSQTQLRKLALRVLEAHLDSLPLSPKEGRWSNYSVLDETPLRAAEELEENDRFLQVRDLAISISPESVLDVGGANGRFISLLFPQSTELTLMDADDFSVTQFVHWIQEYEGKIERPAFIRALNGDFLDLSETAELVVCLALTHHLALTNYLPFSKISSTLSSATLAHLLVEFMPNGRGKAPLPRWYTLDNFVEALRKDFDDVRVVPWDSGKDHGRVLIWAKRKVARRKPPLHQSEYWNTSQ